MARPALVGERQPRQFGARTRGLGCSTIRNTSIGPRWRKTKASSSPISGGDSAFCHSQRKGHWWDTPAIGTLHPDVATRTRQGYRRRGRGCASGLESVRYPYGPKREVGNGTRPLGRHSPCQSGFRMTAVCQEEVRPAEPLEHSGERFGPCWSCATTTRDSHGKEKGQQQTRRRSKSSIRGWRRGRCHRMTSKVKGVAERHVSSSPFETYIWQQ